MCLHPFQVNQHHGAWGMACVHDLRLLRLLATAA